MTHKSKAASDPVALSDDTRMMSEETQAEVLLRLRKVAGQVQGVSRMVDDDRFCVDILQQLAAIGSAVNSVSRIVVRNYLERCVTSAIDSGEPLISDGLMRVVLKSR